MGGTIDIVSDDGSGTTVRFDIFLDVADGEAPPIPPPAAARTTAPVRRLRILLAEDNATNRLVAVTRLEMLGHRVNAVASGQEAIDAVQTVPYDLLLMDVMMPDMDGLEATRAIRALPGPVAEIPIVALTANVFSDHRMACVAAGMDGFLAKPLVVADLMAFLDRTIAGTLRGTARADIDEDTSSEDDIAAARHGLTLEMGAETADLLLATFKTEAETRIQALRGMLAQRDRGALANEADALRSAAATVGRQQAAHLAADLVTTAQDPAAPMDGVANALARLAAALQ